VYWWWHGTAGCRSPDRSWYFHTKALFLDYCVTKCRTICPNHPQFPCFRNKIPRHLVNFSRLPLTPKTLKWVEIFQSKSGNLRDSLSCPCPKLGQLHWGSRSISQYILSVCGCTVSSDIMQQRYVCHWESPHTCTKVLVSFINICAVYFKFVLV
jgi:hypothetical protein